MAKLGKGATRFKDTTAEPTPAASAAEIGRHYSYRVLARTKDGRLLGSAALRVGVPKPGHTVRVIEADRSDAARVSGETGSVLEFPTSKIPKKAQILGARLSLQLPDASRAGKRDALYELHPLKEKATKRNPGELAPVFADGKVSGKALTLDVTSLAHQWVKTPKSNKGVLVGPAEETSSGADVAGPAELRVVTAQPNPWDTYYAPGTPTRMTAANTYPVDVTVTNTTDAAWPAGERELSYRWSHPDGSDATSAANQLKADIPALAPGASATVKATAKAPAVDGNRRAGYTLTWDVRNKADGSWLSEKPGIGGLAQKTAVEDPTADRLGLENYHAYTGEDTGAGSTLMSNLGSGNAAWSYNVFNNPGRGINTFARLTYNAQDTSDSQLGHGWSAQMSGPLRLGGALDVHPDTNPTEAYVVDGDGTQQTFRKQADGSWKPAPGYHYRLTAKAGAPASCAVSAAAEVPDAWTMTRPDGTRFVIGCDGYLTSVVDKNGNTQTYEYELQNYGNRKVKFLTQIKDPSGRSTMKLDYYRHGDATYDYLNAQGEKVSGTNLWNPAIYGHLKSVTDISGRKVSFLYTEKGHLGRITDGDGASQPKEFSFTYDAEQGSKNAKLTKVTDPLRNATRLGYSVTAETDYRWSTKDITDRLDARTDFAYKKISGGGGETKVTDAEQHASTYQTDSGDRPVKAVDAKSQATKLTWDSDNNVTVLEEANGAKTAYCYDPKTGYPLWERSAEENKGGLPSAGDCAPDKSPAHSVRYEYRTRADGYAADLVKKTSAEGRTWQFGYDAKGNLKTVTDPKGVASSEAGDYTTSYDYDAYGQLTKATDANGNPTTYQNFQPSGYPGTTTDALSKVTKTHYDERGLVRSVTDALGKQSTQSYDTFGRPLVSRVPKDQAAGDFITTPAPVYDANDNVTKSTAPNGAIWTASYDKADQITEATAPKDTDASNERRTRYTYDKVGNLRTTTEPKGVATPSDPKDYVTTNVYDEIYQLTEVVNAENDKVRYLYDSVGNVARVIDPKKNASSDPDDYTTKTDYDHNHRVVAVTDAEGRTVKQSYDKDSLVVSTTDQENNTTKNHYDERGKLAVVQVPHTADIIRETKFGYDEVGNQVKVITPRGVDTDEPDDFIAETTYDALNRPARQIQPYDPKDPRYNRKVWTETSYDAVGRVDKVSMPPSEGETTRNDTTYDYFDNGWVKKSTDSWNITTTYDYSALGLQSARQLTSAAGSSSRTMRWGYYPDGKLKSRDDDGIPVGKNEVLGAESQSVKTGTARAGGGDERAWKLTIPESGTYTAYAQSAVGAKWAKLAEKKKYQQDEITTLKADAEQVKLVRDNSADADTERKRFAYGYDVNANLSSIDDTSTGTKIDAYTISYTGLNQVSKVLEALAGEEKKSTSYTYDDNGQVETQTHPDQYSKYTYDLRDLVDTVSVGTSASDASPKVTTYDYTWRGQKSQEIKANKNKVDYTYYRDGSLNTQEEKKQPDGTLVSSHDYAYDANGNKAQDIAKKMNADDNYAYLSSTTDYTYDPADRLAKSVRSGHGAGTETYVHDDNANVVSQTIKGKTTTFGYDRNRLLKATTPEGSVSYQYDPFGRQESVTSGDTVIERNTYDGFDRVVEHGKLDAASGSMKNTRYGYDPLDRTSSKTEGGKTTDFNYLGMSGEVLDEEVAGKLTKSYQYSPWGERLSQVKHGADGAAAEDAYYGYNSHTDVETLTGTDGNPVATYGYTGYGTDNKADFTGIDKPADADPTKEPYNAYRFNSKRWDASSRTYDMGFRDYSPDLNRFTTRDMYNGATRDMSLDLDPLTGNRYAFGSGNPIGRIEIDGHASFECATGALRNCKGGVVTADSESVKRKPTVNDIVADPRNKIAKPKIGVIAPPGTGGVTKADKLFKIGRALASLVGFGNGKKIGSVLDKIRCEAMSREERYQYQPLNEAGGAAGATALICPSDLKAAKSRGQRKGTWDPPGYEFKKDDDGLDVFHRSHIVGDRFHGEWRRENIFTGYRRLNHPGMTKYETKMAKALAAQKPVTYSGKLVYGNGDENLPTAIRMTAFTADGPLFSVTLPNEP
ncbi:DNA/RNA non-specific endonuclease [Streptomyces boninensis]|uniref:DNA/RNA non-specific endonuclease n=1 Tax=Streptomyces boninensis TaxID=2039455 RepID=UPI003B22136B